MITLNVSVPAQLNIGTVPPETGIDAGNASHTATSDEARPGTGRMFRSTTLDWVGKVIHSHPLQKDSAPGSYNLFHRLRNRPAQAVTSVPIFSPRTTRRRLCGLKKLKTMIGIRLSWQSEKAVESITFNRW